MLSNDTNTTKLNIVATIAQTVYVGVSYFCFYRLILVLLGPDILGLWALVLSISSTANFANLGIGSNVVRQIAYCIEDKDKRKESIAKILTTSIFFMFVVFLLTSIIILFIGPFWLQHSNLNAEYLTLAMSLLPYSLMCFFLNGLSVVFFAVIEGLQKNYLKSIVFVISNTILVLSGYVLAKHMGLVGIAYAQLIQSTIQLVAAIFLCKRLLKTLDIRFSNWDRFLLKTILRFGSKELLISVCQLCFDPFTKTMLSKYGGLVSIGYYEMANKLISQLRGVVMNVNQVFTSVFAKLSAQDNAKKFSRDLYLKMFNANYITNLIWIVSIISFAMLFSIFWIGLNNKEFFTYTVLLAIANCINIQSGPAYFANIGFGEINGNVIGNVFIFGINVVLSLVLGSIFGSLGVVLAWMFALGIGSLYIIFSFHLKNQINILLLRRKELLIPTISAVIQILFIVAYSFYTINKSNISLISIGLICLSSWIAVCGFNIFYFRKQIHNFFSKN